MIIRSALNPLASRSLFVLLAVAASCLAAAEPIDGPLPPE